MPSLSMSLPTPRIVRPPNAFMIYRSQIGDTLRFSSPWTTVKQSDVSKLAGELWNNETEEVKDEFRRRAVLLKREHEAMYPDYKVGGAPKGKEKGKKEQKEKGMKKGEGTKKAQLEDPESVASIGAVGEAQVFHYPLTSSAPNGSHQLLLQSANNGFEFNYDASQLPSGSGLPFESAGPFAIDVPVQFPSIFAEEQETIIRILQSLTVEQLMQLDREV